MKQVDHILKCMDHRKSSVQRKIYSYKQCCKQDLYVNKSTSQVKKYRGGKTTNQKGRRVKRKKIRVEIK